MKRLYIAVTEKQNDKFYSYWISATSSDNLLYKLSNPKLIYANAYGTRKEAATVADLWNQSYKNNGTFLFANQKEEAK